MRAEVYIYHPEDDIEYFEEYVTGGYHPTLIGDVFYCGRYVVVHKLGYGRYSTIWLARDQQRQRYVSLKILTARTSRESHEADILQHLMKGDPTHAGKRFIPPLLDQFSFDGLNGQHRCLVGEPAGCSISKSKDDSTDFMFPLDAARSLAAQLVLGLSYLHASDICHGDIHLRNFLLRTPAFHDLSTAELYKRFVSQTPSPTLHTPALYAPPEDFFHEPITRPTAADIWMLGVNMYEVLGERPLFETFLWDRDDIIGKMINTLGRPPTRWWDSSAKQKRTEFFEADRSWVADFARISDPVFRRLHQSLWDMGHGETAQTCVWDVAGGEMRALEEMLRAMMTFELEERPTAEQLLGFEYMVKWALPAWERQRERRKQAGAV
ncbi:kinase domain-containing protein [Bimuria novae-zelandiae CBS 107.79]|uniref:non-specific serine/threonine protein kinase n=1 Tax=Bimuria novae-zelandiae CBS 107.79 TaxID=1447943 RepID=A0A6A5V5L3_9PLEO|nr:kinase domain-containing protein [Bimuria novae-zelandiae CBS 107.79]